MTSLRVITPPAVEPVSLETAKSFLRVDVTDEDALIASLVSTARETGEGLARRAFITQTLEMTVDCWPPKSALGLMRPPLQSVVSVKYYDEANVVATWSDYIVDAQSEPGRIHFNSMPDTTLRASGGVVVRFIAGYGDASVNVPAAFIQGILSLVGHWYENRTAINIGNIVTEVPLTAKALFLSDRGSWF